MKRNLDKLGIIEVTTQEQMDNVPNDFGGIVVINSNKEENIIIYKLECCNIIIKGDSLVESSCNLEYEIYDNASLNLNEYGYVKAYDNSFVCASKKGRIEGYDQCKITAGGITEVEAFSSKLVRCSDFATVKGYGENTKIVIYNQVHGEAYDEARIYANGTSTADVYDAFGFGYDDAVVNSHGESVTVAYSKTVVNAYDKSYVIAKDNASVYKYDNSEIEIEGNDVSVECISE